MIDQIGAIAGTAVYATMVGVLAGVPSASDRRRWTTFIAAAAWGAVVVAVAALGGFEPGATGAVPGPGLAFAALLAVLLGSWFLLPGFRAALLAVPLAALVALNVARLGGVLFLVLAADGRLSAPFAPSAGWGDIITGLFALPLALMARRDAGRLATPLALWNAFGILDLVAAISLGMLSAPGTPLRVFTEGPGTAAMGELPWIMVPALLVPIYLLIHLAIATKLRSAHRLAAAAATEPER